MYFNDLIAETVFETDTQLYRFTIYAKGVKFCWHQPFNLGAKFVTSCPNTTHDFDHVEPEFVTGTVNEGNHLLAELELKILNVAAKNLEEELQNA